MHPSMDKRFRPIYGHIRAADADGRISAPSDFQYGDIFFEMKPEVKDRATFTGGDSLFSDYKPVPLTGDVSDDDKALAWIGAYGRYDGTTKLKDLVDGHSYIEMQILGGATLEEVAVVHMAEPTTPSMKKIYQDLINAGFTVKFTR
jgi:hypothetical protein